MRKDLKSRLQAAFKRSAPLKGGGDELGMSSKIPTGAYRGFPLIGVIVNDPKYVMQALNEGEFKVCARAEKMLRDRIEENRKELTKFYNKMGLDKKRMDEDCPPWEKRDETSYYGE